MSPEDTRSSGAASNFLVRRVTPDEWRDLRALRLRALADAPEAFGATLAEAEAEPDASWQKRADAVETVVIVAEAAGRFVGMASGGRSLIDGSTAGLSSLWVEPAARRAGVAAAIVEAVVDWARTAGYQAVGLGVTTSSAGAIALYERLGFVDIGQRFHPHAGSALEMQIMVRALSGTAPNAADQ